MKKILLVIVVHILWTASLMAQSDTAKTVTVLGTASTQVMADNVAWHLVIKSNYKNQEKLKAQTDMIVAQILVVTDQLKVNQEDIEFEKAKITKRNKYKKRRETNKFSHFEFFQRITVVSKDLNKYDSFLQKFSAIEGVRVSQKFFVSELDSTLQEMRIEAIKDAEQKAKDYASGIKRSIGQTLSVSEFQPRGGGVYINNTQHLTSSSVNNKPDMFNVSARVYVVFELK